MTELLKQLCALNGTSGREEKIREFIISKIEGKCQLSVDRLGNIIAFCEGRKRAKNKVMISAHMDEVGFIVTYITNDGYLKISAVGGIDSKVIVGRRLVIGDNEINGAVTSKPVHLKGKSEKEKCPDTEELFVDIGAKSREEAEKYVSQGDSAYFVSDTVLFGDGFIKAKAIDDRFGVAAMIKMIENGMEYDTYFTFVVQEEVGLRGSACAAYTVNPDYAIVLEATTAGDVFGADEINSVCHAGKGAVVSFMDRSTLYDRKLYMLAKRLAQENNIPFQTKSIIAGGNDAGAIHKSRDGVYTVAVSLPCRYIHSGSSVAKLSDMNSVYDLALLLAKEFSL